MKLIRVHIITAGASAGLLTGLDVGLRSPFIDLDTYSRFDPLCLIGPNGAGKSQFLQVLTEMFQAVIHAGASTEERIEVNPDLQFELEYLIRPTPEQPPVHVRVARQAVGRRRPTIVVETKVEEGWQERKLDDPQTVQLLPRKIVGYTSGDNETLSLPFLVSRSGYADEVGRKALEETTPAEPIADTRLMLIDYGTNLEVLVANLLMSEPAQREALLNGARLQELHSFRCIIQLAHSAAPSAPSRRKAGSARKRIQLTAELEQYLDHLKRCATCYTIDNKTETYTFDFWINPETLVAFRSFWASTIDLYTSFHKLAMLNDLAIRKQTRERFRRDTKTRRFASRLPEPQDEDKVFRFEQVRFTARTGNAVVDYVSLSDGEHQLGQLLGMFGMLAFPNVLFLLDEPESHFNPQWRVKFTSLIREFPTSNGDRTETSPAAEQECLLTTHSPFVPSDLPRESVFIFSKNADGQVKVRHPDIETYGTTFNRIVEECFDVRPPISQVPLDEIKELMASDDPAQIKAGLDRLGHSVQKAFLADHLRELTGENKE